MSQRQHYKPEMSRTRESAYNFLTCVVGGLILAALALHYFDVLFY